MEEIDSVVFDLGGVLVDLDAERCIDAFRRLGMPQIAELINPYHPAAMIGEMEHGLITFHEACERMRAASGRREVTDASRRASSSTTAASRPSRRCAAAA